MKYKVGDKVKIKSLSWYNKNRNEYSFVVQNRFSFTYSMSEYCGKIAAIASVGSDNEHYIIDIDGGEFDWCDFMLDDEQGLLLEAKKDECLNLISLSEELSKERRYNCACMAMQGIVSGIIRGAGLNQIDYPSIVKESYSLADELLKQGGFTE